MAQSFISIKPPSSGAATAAFSGSCQPVRRGTVTRAAARHRRDVAAMEPALARVVATLVAAVLVPLALRRATQRLPLLLTRRALGPTATHPDAAFRRLVHLVLLPLKVGLWAGAAWYATEHFPALHSARDTVAAVARMALTQPLFSMHDRGYSVVDLLTLR